MMVATELFLFVEAAGIVQKSTGSRWSWTEMEVKLSLVTYQPSNLGKIYKLLKALSVKWRKYPPVGFLKTKKYYKRFLAHNKLSEVRDCYSDNNRRAGMDLRDTLVSHLHFIIKKSEAQGNEEMCSRSWTFGTFQKVHCHERRDRNPVLLIIRRSACSQRREGQTSQV